MKAGIWSPRQLLSYTTAVILRRPAGLLRTKTLGLAVKVSVSSMCSCRLLEREEKLLLGPRLSPETVEVVMGDVALPILMILWIAFPSLAGILRGSEVTPRDVSPMTPLLLGLTLFVTIPSNDDPFELPCLIR